MKVAAPAAAEAAGVPAAVTPTARKKRAKKELYVHRAWLDHLLTALFFVEVAWVVTTFMSEAADPSDWAPPMVCFLVYVVAVALVVNLVKKASTSVAGTLNRVLVQRGLVDKAPIAGPVQLKKWQDQAWQLVVHVTMTMAAVFVIHTETPGMWDDMSLSFQPAPWNWKAGPRMRILYQVQLVRRCVATALTVVA